MSTIFPFQISEVDAFQFNPILDGQQYSAFVAWNFAGQCYYLNIHDADRNLVLCRRIVSSPVPKVLAPPAVSESVSSMTWDNADGGRAYFVMVSPSSTVTLNSIITVSGAHNNGTAGDSAINGRFIIDQFTDASNFAALLTAQSDQIGTITGDIVINPDAHALVWRNGVVVATAGEPHGLPMGTVVKVTIDGALPAGYNGTYYCVISGLRDFRFSLPNDPGGFSVQSGNYSQNVNLIEGYFNTSKLIYREDALQFKVYP